MSEPYEDSRRLTGCNLYFAGAGAVLEIAPGVQFDDAALARWRDNIAVACAALSWALGELVVRKHRSGASLAFAAPLDQLYTATEVNEWACWSALLPFSPRPSREREGVQDCASQWLANAALHPGGRREKQAFLHAPGHAAVWDADLALRTLQAMAAAEARPALVALHDAAVEHGLPFLPDEDAVSIGTGEGGRTWPTQALPTPADVEWPSLHAIPTVLVTGSNGKTTTVRLLAAITRAHGWRTAHSCTDGVFFNGAALEAGDFSGPVGGRTAMRHPRAQAAVLETARGGMLRRGLALCHADAAVVTNISADHFGEYGVHDLDDLAEAKLTVARAIHRDGLLVLNADDPVLVRQAQSLACPLGWFSLDFDKQRLVGHRAGGGASCGVRDGRLLLSEGEVEHDLGAVDAMPLSLRGRATYNVANIAAAALAAKSLGVPSQVIATVLARFGSDQGDNPGRLQHWRFGAMDVYLDYAHNPDGLRGLVQAVGADQRSGRLAILLGHAGNREDADLRAVAATAAASRPELVVLKDIADFERGRAPGEIAAIMRATLLGAGIDDACIRDCGDETEAARQPLAWARDGDLVVLPVHGAAARTSVVALLDTMRELGWRPGMPLPLQP